MNVNRFEQTQEISLWLLPILDIILLTMFFYLAVEQVSGLPFAGGPPPHPEVREAPEIDTATGATSLLNGTSLSKLRDEFPRGERVEQRFTTFREGMNAP